jgi:hypothetical protein
MRLMLPISSLQGEKLFAPTSVLLTKRLESTLFLQKRCVISSKNVRRGPRANAHYLLLIVKRGYRVTH